MPSELCPHCGAPLRTGAPACRECGSDFETGWSDDVEYQSVELPEDPGAVGGAARRSVAWRTVAILCIVALLGGLVILLGGEPWGVLLVVAIGVPIALGIRKGERRD